MTDTATNAASAAPVSTEAPAPAATTTEATGTPVVSQPTVTEAAKPAGPMNQGAAKRAAMERYQNRVTQPTAAPVAATTTEPAVQDAVNAAGRKIDPVTKQFLPESGAAPVAALPQDPKPSASVPDGFERIALPDGHPWRRGDKTFVDVPAALAQDARTVINQPVRRNELEAAQTENMRLRARLEVMQSGVPMDPVKDPLLAHLIADVAESYDSVRPGLSDLLKQALTKLPDAEVRARVDEYTAQEQDRARGSQFLAQVNAEAPQKFAVWAQAGELEGRIAQSLRAYGTMLDAENEARQKSGQPFVYPEPADFYRRLDIEYAYDPRVQQRVQAWRQQESQREREQIETRIRAEFAEQEKKKLGEMADRHRSVRGPGQLAAAGRQDGRALTPPAEDLSKLSPSQRQKLARERAIARVGG